MSTPPTSDEKIMAALAHGSVFMAFLGPLIPVGVWAFQRKKSKYVTFHALQAMGYQALMFWVLIVVVFLLVLLMSCLIVPVSIFMMRDSQNAVFGPLLAQIFMILVIFASMGLFFLSGIVGAIFCLLGREFRYPLIGKWLERHLPYSAESPIDEAQEDQWVAGICHATTILQFWGAITPLLVWFTQKERSARLRFQAMQAFFYQLIAFIAYMIGIGLYMALVFGMFLILLAASLLNGTGKVEGPAAFLMVIFFGVVMLFWLVSLILAPLYYLLAAFASLRTIQGRPFHYPLLGRILEKRQQRPQPVELAP
jgi:uncharacterized Tic20 family protein